jgi:hypothetical protein
MYGGGAYPAYPPPGPVYTDPYAYAVYPDYVYGAPYPAYWYPSCVYGDYWWPSFGFGLSFDFGRFGHRFDRDDFHRGGDGRGRSVDPRGSVANSGTLSHNRLSDPRSGTGTTVRPNVGTLSRAPSGVTPRVAQGNNSFARPNYVQPRSSPNTFSRPNFSQPRSSTGGGFYGGGMRSGGMSDGGARTGSSGGGGGGGGHSGGGGGHR